MPRAALILGLAGLLPFVWGALIVLRPDLGIAFGLPRLSGRDVLQAYGFAVFCFMSGALWGFAARATIRAQPPAFASSVAPVLALLAATGLWRVPLMTALLAGFPLLLVLDAGFVWRGLAPRWWLRLRLLLTGGVVLCLGVAVYG